MKDVIDARGLICPLPVLKLAKTLRVTPQGQTVTLWADDPIAIVDVPHYCTETGHTLLSQSDDGDHQVYTIRVK